MGKYPKPCRLPFPPRPAIGTTISNWERSSCARLEAESEEFHSITKFCPPFLSFTSVYEFHFNSPTPVTFFRYYSQSILSGLPARHSIPRSLHSPSVSCPCLGLSWTWITPYSPRAISHICTAVTLSSLPISPADAPLRILEPGGPARGLGHALSEVSRNRNTYLASHRVHIASALIR